MASIRAEREAFLVNRGPVVDGESFRPECDFCPRKLDGFGDRKEVDEDGAEGGGGLLTILEGNWIVGEGVRRVLREGGEVETGGDFARVGTKRDEGRMTELGREGKVLLRLAARECCAVLTTSLLGLRSESLPIRRPSSNSSCSGLAAFD